MNNSDYNNFFIKKFLFSITLTSFLFFDIKYDILLEEERRLFYVAITRAKDELFLITELGNESSFVDEIPQHFYQINKPIINIG